MKIPTLKLWAICLTLVVFASLARAATPPAAEHWVSTWSTAQPVAHFTPPKFAPRGAPPPSLPSPILPFPDALKDQTVRMVMRTTLGGSQLRVQLSNSFGYDTLRIGEARIAAHGSGSSIDPLADHALTFNGQKGVDIPPGAVVVSDPVRMAIRPLAELAVSLYIPEAVQHATVHALGLHSTYLVAGNRVSDQSLEGAEVNQSYFWLAGVEVSAPANSGAIVGFGDSITDGFLTTPNTFHTWPDYLAERLQPTHRWAVLNVGISGNRIRRDGAGINGLARFDRDVLSRPGVRWVILFEGINDINIAGIPDIPESERVTVDEMIAAYSQFIDKAHLHGIKVMTGTLMPIEGLWLYTKEIEAKRLELNHWIKTSGKPDAVVDFDEATRDPAQPSRLNPAYDSGDHIHPNDAGSVAMSKAIDLRAFEK